MLLGRKTSITHSLTYHEWHYLACTSMRCVKLLVPRFKPENDTWAYRAVARRFDLNCSQQCLKSLHGPQLLHLLKRSRLRAGGIQPAGGHSNTRSHFITHHSAVLLSRDSISALSNTRCTIKLRMLGKPADKSRSIFGPILI